MSNRVWALVTTGALLLSACNVFDAPPTDVSNRCEPPALPHLSSEEPFEVQTQDLDDAVNNACGLTDIRGSDGFFAIDVREGERWYIEAHPQELDSDVVLYVLDESCGRDTCLGASNACGAGSYERLLVAPTPGRYLVAVDSAAGGGSVDVVASRQVCGDGMVQPGECCDGGIDCDECRMILRGLDELELEPNDGMDQANVLLPVASATAQRLRAVLGGTCDSDFYLVRVEQQANLEVAMLGANGQPCRNSQLDIRMKLLDADGMPLGEGRTGRAANQCPTITSSDTFARGLAPGDYYVTISSDGHPQAFPYVLDIDVGEAL